MAMKNPSLEPPKSLSLAKINSFLQKLIFFFLKTKYALSEMNHCIVLQRYGKVQAIFSYSFHIKDKFCIYLDWGNFCKAKLLIH